MRICAATDRGFELRCRPLHATDIGLDALGDFAPLPTGAALLGHWTERLPEGQRVILQTLADGWPNALTKEEVAYKRLALASPDAATVASSLAESPAARASAAIHPPSSSGTLATPRAGP